MLDIEPRAAYRARVPHIRRNRMRSVILWLAGVPISVIVLLHLFGVL